MMLCRPRSDQASWPLKRSRRSAARRLLNLEITLGCRNDKICREADAMADYHPSDFFTDPQVANATPGHAAAWRAQAPVLREPFHGAFMVTGYEEAMEVLS